MPFRITPQITLDDADVQLAFVHASGPGGQNVNKVASAVQLRFDAAHSRALDDAVRRRLMSLAGTRLTADGVVVIDARRYRSQVRNRQDALDRLADLIRRAAVPPTPRRATRPSRTARERRLAAKRLRGRIKQQRRSGGGGEEW